MHFWSAILKEKRDDWFVSDGGNNTKMTSSVLDQLFSVFCDLTNAICINRLVSNLRNINVIKCLPKSSSFTFTWAFLWEAECVFVRQDSVITDSAYYLLKWGIFEKLFLQQFPFVVAIFSVWPWPTEKTSAVRNATVLEANKDFSLILLSSRVFTFLGNTRGWPCIPDNICLDGCV